MHPVAFLLIVGWIVIPAILVDTIRVRSWNESQDVVTSGEQFWLYLFFIILTPFLAIAILGVFIEFLLFSRIR